MTPPMPHWPHSRIPVAPRAFSALGHDQTLPDRNRLHGLKLCGDIRYFGNPGNYAPEIRAACPQKRFAVPNSGQSYRRRAAALASRIVLTVRPWVDTSRIQATKSEAHLPIAGHLLGRVQ